MKTTIDLLLTLFSAYTGKSVPKNFKMPFLKKAPLIMAHIDVSKLVVVIEVRGDATALDESQPSTSTIRRTATLRIFHKRDVRKTERFAFNRAEPYLHIGAVEYRDNDERPSEMQVTYSKVKLLPGCSTNLVWFDPCRTVGDAAFRYHEKLQNEAALAASAEK